MGRSTGYERQLVRRHCLLRVAARTHRQIVSSTDRGRMGARSARWITKRSFTPGAMSLRKCSPATPKCGARGRSLVASVLRTASGCATFLKTSTNGALIGTTRAITASRRCATRKGRPPACGARHAVGRGDTRSSLPASPHGAASHQISIQRLRVSLRAEFITRMFIASRRP